MVIERDVPTVLIVVPASNNKKWLLIGLIVVMSILALAVIAISFLFI